MTVQEATAADRSRIRLIWGALTAPEMRKASIQLSGPRAAWLDAVASDLALSGYESLNAMPDNVFDEINLRRFNEMDAEFPRA